jgi:hypothetical protein
MNKLLKHYLLKRNEIKRLSDRIEEDEVENLKDCVYRCILLTHLHWAFWAMIMIPYD